MYNNRAGRTCKNRNGGATASIAGERKDKHTADGVTALKKFHLNLNADNNANYALAA